MEIGISCPAVTHQKRRHIDLPIGIGIGVAMNVLGVDDFNAQSPLIDILGAAIYQWMRNAVLRVVCCTCFIDDSKYRFAVGALALARNDPMRRCRGSGPPVLQCASGGAARRGMDHHALDAVDRVHRSLHGSAGIERPFRKGLSG